MMVAVVKLPSKTSKNLVLQTDLSQSWDFYVRELSTSRRAWVSHDCLSPRDVWKSILNLTLSIRENSEVKVGEEAIFLETNWPVSSVNVQGLATWLRGFYSFCNWLCLDLVRGKWLQAGKQQKPVTTTNIIRSVCLWPLCPFDLFATSSLHTSCQIPVFLRHSRNRILEPQESIQDACLRGSMWWRFRLSTYCKWNFPKWTFHQESLTERDYVQYISFLRFRCCGAVVTIIHHQYSYQLVSLW
jgi:hypothetical protein